MVAEAEYSRPLSEFAEAEEEEKKAKAGPFARLSRLVWRYGFSSLTRRIILLNAGALIILLAAILFLNQFRAGLIDARVESLLTQSQIIAAAIASSATVDTGAIAIDPEKLLELKAGESATPGDTGGLEFPINPERAAPILRRLISPTKTRAKIYDREGVLVVDSRNLYLRGQVLSYDLPPLEQEKRGFFNKNWDRFISWVFKSDLPIYEELGPENGKGYPEVAAALNGASVSIVRVNERREMIVSVAVPVQHFRAVLGAMVLSTQGGDIDNILHAERWGIVRVFLALLGVTTVLSLLLAGTIAEPVHRLAGAAEQIRKGIRSRVEIPDFTSRRDEIGDLSGALRDMTTALYNRIDGTERFAADVAHELKNPLTSLRSAVETLPLAKTTAQSERLIAIVQDDIRRLDRLISDISDASRLDAELAREEAGAVDIAELLETLVTIARETHRDGEAEISLDIQPAPAIKDPYKVSGHDIRLGQVVRNLLDNAMSFTTTGDMVRVRSRHIGKQIEITVEDDGPGIQPENLARIFDRFHTDRPEEDAFAKNSGLGLSISKQIVEAHEGQIWAENRVRARDDDKTGTKKPDAQTGRSKTAPETGAAIIGARFVVRLPAILPAGGKSRSS